MNESLCIFLCVVVAAAAAVLTLIPLLYGSSICTVKQEHQHIFAQFVYVADIITTPRKHIKHSWAY